MANLNRGDSQQEFFDESSSNTDDQQEQWGDDRLDKQADLIAQKVCACFLVFLFALFYLT